MMNPEAAFPRSHGGQPLSVPSQGLDGALALLRRLPPEALRAASALAATQDARSERVLRQITRLLLAADLDAALDAAAQEIDLGVQSGLLTEAEIEEAAVRLTAIRS